MIGLNGGLIGSRRVPLPNNGPGMWTHNEQSLLKRADAWVNDSSFNSVSLLLHMDGSNNSTTFADSSINAFTVTPSGDAKISTTQSKFDGASALFDGAGDRLSIASNSAFDFSTGSFTIELWVYHVALTADKFYVSSEGSGGLFFGVGTGGATSNQYIGWGRTAIAWDGSALHGMSTSTWYHVALCRSGSSMRLFVNGSQIGTTVTNSTSYDLSTTALNIGSQGANYYLNAYIDDLRVTKGVARYTANFTAPSSPFPNS